jgi:transglutaminase-like putative cysteine protease
VKLIVSSRLSYTLDKPTDFVFQVHVAKTSTQSVESESFTLSSNPVLASATVGDQNRIVRACLPVGQTDVTYEATVDITAAQYDPAMVGEFAFAELPPEVLTYLLPSRFCPADLFAELAEQQFDGLPRGYSRALAISDWVHATLAYETGSTGPLSTAADVFQQGKGVCRDFAHLAISVCRAAGIPARYVSVYADALSPPDFHAVAEVYLKGPDGGAWFVIDPTHMASADAVARISVGRDAADVAFAWTLGNVDSTSPAVSVSAPGRADTSRNMNAIVGS